MKWLWRVVGVIAVIGWLYVSGVLLIAFGASAYSALRGTHPASFFERRDATTCPGYGERDDDELSACIHQANLARMDWMLTRSAVSHIADMGEMLLLPPLAPLLVWALVRAVNRGRRRRAA